MCFIGMVRLKTIQASAFRTVFEVLKDIINDVNLVFRCYRHRPP